MEYAEFEAMVLSKRTKGQGRTRYYETGIRALYEKLNRKDVTIEEVGNYAIAYWIGVSVWEPPVIERFSKPRDEFE